MRRLRREYSGGGSGFGVPVQPPSRSMPMPGSVPMLLVGGVIGGIGCELLVDTGAQSTVLSRKMMMNLGLQGRLDRSLQGVAQGVGNARDHRPLP